MKVSRRTLHNTFSNGLFSLAALYLMYGMRGLIETLVQERYPTVHLGLLAIIFLGLGSYYVRHLRKADLAGALLILTFLTYCILSYGWSNAPNATVRAVMGLLGAFICALAIWQKWGLETAERFAGIGLVYIVVMLPLFVLGIESVQHTAANGITFAGWTGHKNSLGIIAGFGASVFYARFRTSLRWRDLLAFLVLAVAIVAARSSSSLVGVIGVIGLVELALFGARRAVPFILFFVLALSLTTASIFVFSIIWQDFLMLLGEDTTLSSRTIIWAIVIAQASEHAWLGGGFGAFWVENGAAATQSAQTFYGTTFTQAHNGLLDLWAQAGFIGAGLGLLVLGYGFLRTYRIGAVEKNMTGWAGLVFLIFNNLGEANLFSPNYFALVILFVSALSMKKKDA